MCGLAGKAVIGGDVLTPEAEARLRRMSHALAHRGPDGERVVVHGPVGLAFRRLALVDPTGGDQPLFDEQETVAVIANGEVYNHRDLERRFPDTRFRTRSDCEVLAHLYARDGLRFLDDVLGMFALILHDRRRGRLVLARDRFGIKPLYYARVGETVLVASEIKALFQDPACPRELDWPAALGDQVVHAAPYLDPRPVTSWFRGIEVVPAGTIVSIDLASGATEQHTYWSLPDFNGDSDASDADIVRAYRDLLEQSVADCASADAEVGLFLSGGIDSSVVAALAARTAPLHTFTVLSGSTLANQDAESAHAVAAALGLPNHQVLFDARRIPAPDEWKRLLWLLETPLCGPEQFYKYELYRYVKHLRPSLKGMLLGQASDEFNGGYSVQLSGGTDWAGFEQSLAGLARARALHTRPALSAWLSHHEEAVFSDALLRDGASLLDDPYQAFLAWKYRDIQQYNCWHEDRTAAGNGVEARVPFLDHRIIELMASVPAARRASLLWDKTVLRAAAHDLLPPEIVERGKVSFYHGDGAEHTHRTFARMLAQAGGALVEEALASPGAQQHLRVDAVRSMVGRLCASSTPSGSEFPLRLVNLGLLDQMLRDLPVPPVDAPRADLPVAAPIRDWDRDVPALATRLRHNAEPGLTDVVGLADGVLVVHPPADPDTLYVAVDGQFEYVVDALGEPDWCAFLRHIDGERTLADVLDTAGVSLAAVRETLLDSLEAGLLVAGRPTEVEVVGERVPMPSRAVT